MSDIVHLQFNPSPPPPENDKYKNDKLVFLRPPPPLRERMTKFISYRCFKLGASYKLVILNNIFLYYIYLSQQLTINIIKGKLSKKIYISGRMRTVKPIYITKIQQTKTHVQCNEIVTIVTRFVILSKKRKGMIQIQPLPPFCTISFFLPFF